MDQRVSLITLGVEDLRLSAAESAELLTAEADATGTVWAPGDAARLHARTEGWIIGVHLGVLSRRGHSATAQPHDHRLRREVDERDRVVQHERERDAYNAAGGSLRPTGANRGERDQT